MFLLMVISVGQVYSQNQEGISTDFIFIDTLEVGYYFVCNSDEYNNGNIDGLLRKYRSDDSVLVNTFEMKNGLRHGIATKLVDDSIVVQQAEFIQGKLEGKVFGYYVNGAKSWEYSMSNGEIHGKYVYYYESGDTVRLETYSKGLLDGSYRSFRSKNKLRFEIVYEKGVVVKSTYYKRNGKIKLSTH